MTAQQAAILKQILRQIVTFPTDQQSHTHIVVAHVLGEAGYRPCDTAAPQLQACAPTQLGRLTV